MAINYKNAWFQTKGTDPGALSKPTTVSNPVQNTTAPRPTLPTVKTPLLSYRATKK